MHHLSNAKPLSAWVLSRCSSASEESDGKWRPCAGPDHTQSLPIPGDMIAQCGNTPLACPRILRNVQKCRECSFNKREEDFATRSEWDNYLEAREDIAFNLIEGIDIAATTERLARFERENAESIVAVAAKQVAVREGHDALCCCLAMAPPDML